MYNNYVRYHRGKTWWQQLIQFTNHFNLQVYALQHQIYIHIIITCIIG